MSEEPQSTPTPESPEKIPTADKPSTTQPAVNAAQGTVLETGLPADQMKPSTLRKCRYIFDVLLQNYMKLFTISFIEDNPKMAAVKADLILAENVRNPDSYILRMQSIEALE